jgi:gas vesicle protein
MKIKNVKEEVTHDMQNLRKKNQTGTQNIMEGYSSRLEQLGDRISELEDKIQIKEKTEELLNNSRPMKRICKSSQIPSKDQT